MVTQEGVGVLRARASAAADPLHICTHLAGPRAREGRQGSDQGLQLRGRIHDHPLEVSEAIAPDQDSDRGPASKARHLHVGSSKLAGLSGITHAEDRTAELDMALGDGHDVIGLAVPTLGAIEDAHVEEHVKESKLRL